MRCPKCRKEMAYEAVTHGCGWRAGTGGVVVDEQDRQAKSSPEVVEAAIEKMRSILHAPPRKKDEVVKKEIARVPMLSDVGHGTVCCCQICWQMRMREVFPDAVLLSAQAAPGVPESATTGEENPASVDTHGVAPSNAAPRVTVEPAKLDVPKSPGDAAPESKLDFLRRMFPL